MNGSIPDIHRSLLEDLSDGVMAVDFDGQVQTVNPAFCRMFGLDREKTVGSAFGEAFVSLEGFDAFTEAVFDAILERGAGERRIVGVTVGGEQRSLSVVTSRLTAARDGGTEPVAMIVVVSDITEVRELRETELRMAKVVEKQLGELQGAYRDLEARNEAISAMRKRVRLMRGFAVAFVAVLFLAIGGWYVQPLDLPGIATAPDAGTGAVGERPLATMKVRPQPLRSTLQLRGRLAPGRIEEVVSPIEGHVSAVHAGHGQRVAVGDPLVAFDTGKIEGERRRAEIAHVKARDRLLELENWASSAEMARARGSLRRAKRALNDAERKLERVVFLLDRGIIPASEHEAAQRSLEDRKLDLEATERDFAAVAAKGGAEARRLAHLEVQNAHDRLRAAAAKLDRATVRAPVAGIVSVSRGAREKPVVRGRAMTEGERLMSIADLGYLSVETSVGEVDVRKIQAGQRAQITGPGFPGLKIEARVVRVSSQASALRRRGGPQFQIAVVLDPLAAADRDRVRVGMSAHVAVVVYDRPAALLVPIGAVEQSGGKAWLRVLDRGTGAAARRAVTLGITTLDSVEVTQGLAAGDEIVLAAGGGRRSGIPASGAGGGPGVFSR